MAKPAANKLKYIKKTQSEILKENEKPEELAACQGGRANSLVLVLAAPQP